jgi:hypothetical protein
MNLPYLTVLAFLGALAFSVVLIAADREQEASMERLSEYRIAHDFTVDADPGLKRVSMNSPYMRDER